MKIGMSLTLKSVMFSLFLLAAFAGSALAYTVSGTVSYGGSKTGRVYVTLTSANNSSTAYGVSIAAPGSYTIRGVPDGSYTLRAYLDVVGIRERHPGDPSGSSLVNVSGANVPGADVTINDPVPAALPPAGISAVPGDASAFIMWRTQRDVNGVQSADTFNLYWSTDPSFLSSWPSITADGSFAGIKTSERTNVFMPTSLVNNTTYYYLMEGVTGSVVSSQTVTAAVTPAAPTSGNPVSGTITFSGFTTGAQTKLHVVLYSESGGVYFSTIADPSSPQAYSVPGVADGTYALYPVFDLDGNGLIDIGDVLPDQSQVTRVTVSGAAVTTADTTVAAADGAAVVATSHWKRNNGCEEGYGVNLSARDGRKIMTNAAVYSSGSNSVQISGPIDLGPNQWGEFFYWTTTTRPNVNDRFDFDVKYADSDIDTFTLTRYVTAVLDAFPTPLSPAGVIAATGTPAFSWTPASVGYAHTHQIRVGGNNAGWELRDLLDTKTTATYNEDGNANPSTLSADTPYEWTISLRDNVGNEAQVQTRFAMGSGISGTVTNAGSAGIGCVQVRVYTTGTQNDVTATWTNTDGSYGVGGYGAGEYRLYFDGTVLGYANEWYNDKASWNAADNVTVNAGAVTPDISATLSALHTLTVATAGTAAGNVLSTPPGIDCGNGNTNCTAIYTDTTSVDLNANPATGSVFAGWSGDCTGTGTCTVAMSSARSVVATFMTATYTVSANANAGGTLDGSTPSPVTVNYGSTVSFRFNADTGKHITTINDSVDGQVYSNTTNSVTTYTYTTPPITQPRTITANFADNIFTVTPYTSGTGSISPDTPQNVSYGVSAPFTITPGANHHVVSVTGCGGTWSGSNPYTTAAVYSNCSVTAIFAIDTFGLTVTKSGTGTGVVTASTGTLIWAGSTGTATYDYNTPVTLSAAADASADFTGWSGEGCSGTGTCVVSMTAARSVTATFAIKTYTVMASVQSGSGTISPVSAVVSHGSTTTFTVTPDSGYMTSMNGTCGGTLAGTTFTTNPVTGDCTVVATFILIDPTPDPFSFTPQSGVTRSAVITSNSITVTGINVGVPISVDIGQYSVNNGPWTALTGTANNNDTVRVRQAASANYSSTTDQTLTIGGVPGVFSVTTEALDAIPDPIVFTDQIDVALGATVTSNSITVSGINTGVMLLIAGGEYSVNSGPWTALTGTVFNGDTVQVRHTASASYGTAINTFVSVGGVSDLFTTTTIHDTTPDAFSFTDQSDVAVGTTVTSNSITVNGITTGVAISIAGGEYEINNSAVWTTATGTVNNGNTVRVRHISSASNGAATNTTLTIGGVSDTFTSTTIHDTTPDAFSFTDQSDVAVGTTVTSNSITVNGITTGVAISITGGEYSVNGGVWTAATGTVNNGNTVQVRHTTSASNGAATNTTLTVGGVSDTFTTTTIHDTTPDAFSFTDQTGVSLSTVVTSNSITVNGITTGVAISISGGEYEVNGNAVWTTATGTVNNGNTVRVRHTSSASNGAATNTTLTVGGVSDTFTTMTIHDTTPDAFSFTDQTGVSLSTVVTSNSITVNGITTGVAISISGGEYEVNGNAVWTTAIGTVNNGDTVKVRQTSSASYITATNTILTIGGVSDTFTTTTIHDTTPNTFSFADQTNVNLNTQMTSNSITVSSITTGVSISVVGGEYSVNGSGWTTADGTVFNNDTVQVRHTSSASYVTAVNTTLTIGGVSDTFTTTTIHDTTPDAFFFTDQTGVSLNTVVTSNSITVSGITTGVAISITGGQYSVNGGVWTTAIGTASNNDTVRVRQTSSAAFSTTTDAMLTIGGVSDTFSVTTEPMDTVPNAFSFTDQTGVSLSTVVTSNSITVSGINTGVAISVADGAYSVNGGVWTTVDGTVVNNDSVQVRHLSSASHLTAVNTILTIGGVSDTFTTTTIHDTTPDAFSFTDRTDVSLSTVVTSNSITVSGITTGVPISITGGEYEINFSTAWTTAAGTVNNGSTVRVRHTSSASNGTATNTILTIGGVSDTFTTTTINDTAPDAFSFTDQTGVSRSTVVTSNSITVSGITTGVAISITGGEYSVDGGVWTSATGTVSNGNTVQVRHTSSGLLNTPVDTTLTIGGASDIFTSTTRTLPDGDIDGAPGITSSDALRMLQIVSGLRTQTADDLTYGDVAPLVGGLPSPNGVLNGGDVVVILRRAVGLETF